MSEVTQWFQIKDGLYPKQKGCYETDSFFATNDNRSFQYWDGYRWSTTWSEPEYVFDLMVDYAEQPTKWRGLANKPKVN